MLESGYHNQHGRVTVTRSHIGAALVLGTAIVVLAFLVGLELGRDLAGPAPEPGEAAAAFLPATEDDRALELLLREVEAARRAKEPLPSAPVVRSLAEPQPELPAEPPTESQPTSIDPGDAPKGPESPATAPSGWSIQVASFQDRDQAEARVKELVEQGHKAYRVEALVSGQAWHRVRIGAFTDKAAAEAARLALTEKTGQADLTLTHEP